MAENHLKLVRGSSAIIPWHFRSNNSQTFNENMQGNPCVLSALQFIKIYITSYSPSRSRCSEGLDQKKKKIAANLIPDFLRVL